MGRGPAAYAAAQRVARDVQRQRRHQYGQVYEHHGPQRIQHPVAGVDPRGEYDVLVADRPAQAVYRADHGERAQEDETQAPESAARRQPEQGSDKRHRKTYPEHEGHRVAGVPERFLHELELGPAHHGHGGAAVERLEVLDQDDLGDLEEDRKADEDEEVAAPEVRRVETESLSDVVGAADGVLCRLGPEERAYLIWS